jgi:hypothetical protein
MKINPGKSKAVSFTKARVKEQIRYCSNLNWADHVNYTLQKAWKALHFIMCILKKGNNTKHLAYTTLVRPILEYGAVCWDPYRDQVSALNHVQNRMAKFAHYTTETGWESLAQHRMIARICTLVKAYTSIRAWKSTGDKLVKPCYLSRVDHNRKIGKRKQ